MEGPRAMCYAQKQFRNCCLFEEDLTTDSSSFCHRQECFAGRKGQQQLDY